MTQSASADPIADFVSAVNDHDGERLAGLFAEDAVVVDDGHEYADGPSRARWVQEHNIDPRITLSETAVEDGEAAGTHTLTATAHGDFPGGPLRFAFRFTLDGARVSRLEIGIAGA